MNNPLSLETNRLHIRWLTPGDAAFIQHLVNEPDWIRFIGDRGVGSLADAKRYLETGPLAMYDQYGFGLNLIELKPAGTPIGICGLLQREHLDNPDLGFALLPAFRRQGYAFEAAAAVLRHARATMANPQIDAILTPDNAASRELLLKLGFEFTAHLEAEPDAIPLDLYRLSGSVRSP